MISRTLLSLFAALLFARNALSAPAYYVSHSGTFATSVQTDTGTLGAPFSLSYNSGNLQQHSISGGNQTSDSGTLTFQGTPHIQSADGSIADTAQVGSLHTLVKASVTTNDYPYIAISNSTATSDIHSIASWFDTVTFHTTNPNGSDFTASIYLDDHIDNSATQTGGDLFSIGSRIQATLSIAGLIQPPSFPFLSIVDSEYISSDGPVAQPPPSFVQAYTFHITNGQTLTFLETLDVRSTALGGNTSTVADVANTAGFLLSSSDPAASYSAASGTTFPVPEPSSLLVLAFGCGLLVRRSRVVKHFKA